MHVSILTLVLAYLQKAADSGGLHPLAVKAENVTWYVRKVLALPLLSMLSLLADTFFCSIILLVNTLQLVPRDCECSGVHMLAGYHLAGSERHDLVLTYQTCIQPRCKGE